MTDNVVVRPSAAAQLGEMEEITSGRDRILLSALIDLAYRNPEQFNFLLEERERFEARRRERTVV
jgi:hypothetical protein